MGKKTEVFLTSEKLQEFVGIRVRYLFVILKESLASQQAVTIEDEATRAALIDVAELVQSSWNARQDSSLFSLLVIHDSMQFAHYWVSEWNGLLSNLKSVDELQQKMKKTTPAAAAAGIAGSSQAPVLSTQSFKSLRLPDPAGAAVAVKEETNQDDPKNSPGSDVPVLQCSVLMIAHAFSVSVVRLRTSD